jgi:hypothetical protein
MSRNIFLSLAVLFLCIHTLPVSAQDVPSLLMQAGVLEKSFKDDEALQKYMEVTKKDPLNPDALCRQKKRNEGTAEAVLRIREAVRPKSA